ncbi:YIP1 family protein [Candidatus Marsarchaeota archaeon]|nr:YIP1 family protein [Candidatus Marsarchaeota archaeon]
MIVDDLKNGIDVVLHPDKRTKAKMSVVEALGMYYKFSVIPLILAIILAWIVSSVAGSSLSGLLGGLASGGISVLAVILVVVSLWVTTPITMLIIAAVLHAVGKVLKMFKGTYENTFTGVVFAEFPTVSVYWLSFIPVIGAVISLLASIWGIWVFLNAEANQHSTTKVNAFIVGLVTVIIIAIVVFVIAGVALFSILGVGSSLRTTGIAS